MAHHVAVGVDGSPESRAAAHWAAREAELRGVSLRVVYAADWQEGAAAPAKGSVTPSRWADDLLAETLEALRRVRPDLEITSACLPGSPSTVLAAEASDAGLLVLGSRGLGSAMGFLVGSVSLAALSAVETPVVLVRETGAPEEAPRAPHGDIVVGLDIQQSCDTLLSFAFEEAARRDCSLRVVHCWKLPPAFAYAPMLDPAIEDEISRSVLQTFEDVLLPWKRKFPSVAVEGHVMRGSAGHRLVQACSDAGLVVVGRLVRRSPVGARLGPVAHAVLHHAAPPVAVLAHE